MKTKQKITTILILGLLLVVIGMSTVSALNKAENETITMNGVTFNAPKTDNYTISNATDQQGGKTFTYDDKKNELYVYVCDNDAPEYSLQENWDKLDGYSQKLYVGDKTVVACSKYSENKDFVLETCVANATSA